MENAFDHCPILTIEYYFYIKSDEARISSDILSTAAFKFLRFNKPSKIKAI